MNIQCPKPKCQYWFIRASDCGLDWLVYERCEDGSALVSAAESQTIWENVDDAWQEAWSQIVADGFVLYREALKTGLVAPSVEPPIELTTMCGTPQPPDGDASPE